MVSLCNPLIHLDLADNTRLELPETFLEDNGYSRLVALTQEEVCNLAQLAFEFYRPELLGEEMDYKMEDKIHRIFQDLESKLRPRDRDLAKYRIQYIRSDPWRVRTPALTWNVLIGNHLVISFRS